MNDSGPSIASQQSSCSSTEPFIAKAGFWKRCSIVLLMLLLCLLGVIPLIADSPPPGKLEESVEFIVTEEPDSWDILSDELSLKGEVHYYSLDGSEYNSNCTSHVSASLVISTFISDGNFEYTVIERFKEAVFVTEGVSAASNNKLYKSKDELGDTVYVGAVATWDVLFDLSSLDLTTLPENAPLILDIKFEREDSVSASCKLDTRKHSLELIYNES